MTKVVAGDFALDMGVVDLTVVTTFSVTVSNSNTIVANGGGFTATMEGPAFGGFLPGGLPTTGIIKTFQLDLGADLVFKLSKLVLTVEDLIAFGTLGDIDGLREYMFVNNDQIYGSNFNDNLLGFDGNDIMEGRGGRDSLNGGAGKDQLYGGLGQDLMTGGTENDTFKFKALNEGTKKITTTDRITDLESGDTIDLRGIDADTGKAGNNAFHLVAAFTGEAGELALEYQSGPNRTLLKLDVNGDSKADMIVVLDGDQTGYDHFVF